MTTDTILKREGPGVKRVWLAAVDKALKVTTHGGEFLVHLEFQSGHDSDLVDRLFWYNAVLYHDCFSIRKLREN